MRKNIKVSMTQLTRSPRSIISGLQKGETVTITKTNVPVAKIIKTNNPKQERTEK